MPCRCVAGAPCSCHSAARVEKRAGRGTTVCPALPVLLASLVMLGLIGLLVLLGVIALLALIV